MKDYLAQLQYILDHGEKKEDRTGTGTLSVFGYQNRYDLRDGFPLVTTKKIFFHSVLRELLWFIKGETNIHKGLKPHSSIWDPWADENGDLGPVYGYQWRHWEKFRWNDEKDAYEKSHVDQLKEVITAIKTDPSSRRLIVSAWNVSDLEDMALAPCHSFFQFNVAGEFLDLQLYQRSADVAIGVPFNIASYALLLMMVAQDCQLTPRHFVHSFGDTHLYLNHLEGVKEQLTRIPGPRPQVEIANKPFFDLDYEDFTLLNYEPQAHIKLPIAV